MNKELINHVWNHCLPKEFKEEVKELYDSGIKMMDIRPSESQVYANKLSTLEYLFGLHNLTSDAEGEERLTVSRKKVQEMFVEAQKAVPTCEHDRGFRNAELTILRNLFGSKCLPDETKDGTMDETKEPKPAEPKFKVGDKVRISCAYDNGEIWDKVMHGRIATISSAYWNTQKILMYKFEENIRDFAEHWLKPYTGPQATTECSNLDKEASTCTDDCQSQCPSHLRNLSQKTANCDKCPKSVQKTPPDFGHSRLNIAAMALQGILANSHQQMVEMNVERVVDLAILTADTLIAECNSPIN